MHRDLLAYTLALGCETDQVVEPQQIVAPMLARFMLDDRAFEGAPCPTSSINELGRLFDDRLPACAP